jgi:hypothetical protein
MRSYTPEDILALDPPPCAPDEETGEGGWPIERLEAVFAAHGVAEATMAEILVWTDVPTMDRLWLATHRQVWPTLPVVARRGWLDATVERAIRHAQDVEGDLCPAWASWAERWIRGEDRTSAAARAARAAAASAWAAARAAWASAAVWAARAAVWAAVWEEEVWVWAVASAAEAAAVRAAAVRAAAVRAAAASAWASAAASAMVEESERQCCELAEWLAAAESGEEGTP